MHPENPPVKVHLLEEGFMPRRETEGAIGYDVRLRAIVSAHEMDPENPKLRRTLFDFNKIIDPGLADHIDMRTQKGSKEPEYAYRLEPGRMVLCGIGFCTEMPFPLCYLSLPRSGMASKHHIVIANAPGTIDPDYRGEAGIILYNCGFDSFYIFRKMRIAQILFTWAVIPEILEVESHAELAATERGAGGFGSTGTR